MTANALLPAMPEVTVEERPSLGRELPGAVRMGPFSQVRQGAVLAIIPRVARFLAEEGRSLAFAMEEGGEREDIGVWAQGHVTAMLVHQRGEIPLHAASLVPPGGGGAVAIVGDKGAGKSTLAAALLERGWTLVNDDLTRIAAVPGGVVAWPGRGGIRLRPDAAAYFGLHSLPPVAGDAEKLFLKASAAAAPVPLRMVIRLDRGGDGGETLLQGAAAAGLVSRYTHRIRYVAPLGMFARHLDTAAAIAGSCTVLRLAHAAPPRALAQAVDLRYAAVSQAEACEEKSK